MSFQKYVYTVCWTSYDGTQLGFGCYPNFKQAYERIEETIKGRYDFLIDLNIKDDTDDYTFEAIKITPTRYGRHVESRRCTIMRSLLTVYNESETVSYDTVEQMLKALKKDSKKYKLVGDFL